MAQRYPQITDRIRRFIEAQQMFFVGTAARTGRVNVSPKGLDTLRILGPDRVAWLNLTGSGNETAAHVLDLPRMTLMFCAAAPCWVTTCSISWSSTSARSAPGDAASVIII